MHCCMLWHVTHAECQGWYGRRFHIWFSHGTRAITTFWHDAPIYLVLSFMWQVPVAGTPSNHPRSKRTQSKLCPRMQSARVHCIPGLTAQIVRLTAMPDACSFNGSSPHQHSKSPKLRQATRPALAMLRPDPIAHILSSQGHTAPVCCSNTDQRRSCTFVFRASPRMAPNLLPLKYSPLVPLTDGSVARNVSPSANCT